MVVRMTIYGKLNLSYWTYSQLTDISTAVSMPAMKVNSPSDSAMTKFAWMYSNTPLLRFLLYIVEMNVVRTEFKVNTIVCKLLHNPVAYKLYESKPCPWHNYNA